MKRVWFGPPGRLLAGFVHAPPGLAHGPAVVLCPPLGRDHIVSYVQYRQVADQLAEAGLVALRFDYDGIGDSDGGLGDPDRVEAWTESIVAAVRFLGEHGATRVSLVGLRLSCLLTVEAARRVGGVARIVAWDPQVSGRAFLREQLLLARMATRGVEAVDDGSVHGFGAVFSTAVAREVSSLRAQPTDGPVAERLLVLQRPDAVPDAMITSTWAERVDVAVSTEQEEIFVADPPRLARNAAATLVSWLAEDAEPLEWITPAEAGPAVVHDRVGRPLLERPWRSADGLLYGVLSEPLEPPEKPAPRVLLLPPGSWHRIGLGRMWVNVARDCATNGVTALRLDVSGLGDSGVRPGQPIRVVYADEAVEDILTALRELDDGHGVRLVGHCSGAWNALEAAVRMTPEDPRLVSVNAIGTPAYLDRTPWLHPDAPLTATRSSLLHRVVLRVGRRDALERHRQRVPAPVWRALDRLGILPSPARRLQVLLDRGVAVHLISDQRDAVWWHAEGRAWHQARQSDPLFSAHELPYVDHQMAAAASRQRIGSLLRQQLLASDPS